MDRELAAFDGAVAGSAPVTQRTRGSSRGWAQPSRKLVHRNPTAYTPYMRSLEHVVSTFPGADLIERGLYDLAHGSETIEAFLVSIAAPRLRTLGFAIPAPFEDPELRLYHRLATEFGNGAHSRYNALLRRVVSFQRAAACAK